MCQTDCLACSLQTIGSRSESKAAPATAMVRRAPHARTRPSVALAHGCYAPWPITTITSFELWPVISCSLQARLRPQCHPSQEVIL